MPVIIDRDDVLGIHQRFEKANAVVPVFCADGPEDIEMGQIAVRDYSRRYGIEHPALGVSLTVDYPDMSQAARYFRCGDKIAGVKAFLSFLDILCGKGGPYSEISVIPNLDHSDVQGEEYLWQQFGRNFGTVLIDGSLRDRTFDENMELTAAAVKRYGSLFVVEACPFRPPVEGAHQSHAFDELRTPEDYASKVRGYLQATGADYCVAELGSAQQSTGWGNYKPEVAQAVTAALNGKHRLVLHGGSSIPPAQMESLGYDGISRFNIWTRPARESAQAGARAVIEAQDIILNQSDAPAEGPKQLYRTRFRDAYVDQGALSFGEILEKQQYRRLADVA